MQTSIIRAPSSHPTASPERSPDLLDRQTFLVRERVGFAKLTDTYDLLDPATQQTIGIAKEEPPVWAKWLRLLVNKRLLPTTINVYGAEESTRKLSIHRSVAFLSAKVEVRDRGGKPMGYLKSKVFSLGGGFRVYLGDQEVAEVKGDWKGWDFKLTGKDGHQLGRVTKKWAGIGKELFTSADTYVISLDGPPQNRPAATLLLAAGLAIDMVFKER